MGSKASSGISSSSMGGKVSSSVSSTRKSGSSGACSGDRSCKVCGSSIVSSSKHGKEDSGVSSSSSKVGKVSSSTMTNTSSNIGSSKAEKVSCSFLLCPFSTPITHLFFSHWYLFWILVKQSSLLLNPVPVSKSRYTRSTEVGCNKSWHVVVNRDWTISPISPQRPRDCLPYYKRLGARSASHLISTKVFSTKDKV